MVRTLFSLLRAWVSIPGWGARIPYAAQHSQKKKEMGENRNGEGIKTWTSLGKTSQE